MKWIASWRTWLGACTLIACLGPAQAAGACKLAEYGALPVEMVGGLPTTQTKVNGVDTRFILGTGLEFNLMSRANADALGLQLTPMPTFGFQSFGLDELTSIKDFGILGTDLHNIQFAVGRSDAGEGQLGANLLDLADLEIDLAQGKVTVFRPVGCDNASLAYWAGSGNYFVADLHPSHNRYDRRSFVDVTINGKTLHALLSSGNKVTFLSQRAAERIGIDLSGLVAKAASDVRGTATRTYRTEIVPIDAFSVGTETIHHSEMLVMEGDIGGSIDLMLGADFMLAHHLYVANSQRKLYLTYNGGRVFSLDAASIGANEPASTASNAAGDNPVTAADYALRGQARFARGELANAHTDLDTAIRMDPGNAGDYLVRARVLVADKQPDAALADLEKALSFDPKNLEALLLRARLRYQKKDEIGAEADIAAARQLAPAGSMQSYAIASFYVVIDRPADALPLLDEWIRTHDKDILLGNALSERCRARVLADQSLDEALHDCREAIKRDGEHLAYLDNLGLVYLRMGNDAEAIKSYQKALAQSPNTAWAHYGLGLAELRSGYAAAGKVELATARSLDKSIDARGAKLGLVAPDRPPGENTPDQPSSK